MMYRRAIPAALAAALVAGPALSATPREVLLSCISAAGIKTEFTIQSGFAGRLAFSYIDAGPGVTAERAAAINRCADRSGGHTGLGNALPPSPVVRAPVPVSVPQQPVIQAAPPPRSLPPQQGYVTRQQPSYGCVPGFGVMQRGNLYCVGY